MNLFAQPDETIVGTLSALRAGKRTCLDVLEACLSRIDEREDEIEAWVLVDRDGARARARQLDAERAAGRWAGPLHGIPIGVKDIVNVAGLPTAAGAPEWADRIASEDAAMVADLRRWGVVILGKTVTTAYAWIDPPPTRNPWATDRTPGGSSSGSAAAVACGMCLGAIGSQTGGSITRPAAYCGVAGFKPTYASRSVNGILPLAPSLDHPGPIARTVADLAMLGDIVPQKRREGPPRIGRLRGLFDDRAEPSMRTALDRTLSDLDASGAKVIDIPLPDGFEDFPFHHYLMMAAEAASIHEQRRAKHPDQYPPRISKLIDDGLSAGAVGYVRAREFKVELRQEMMSRLARVDVLATPAATGPAPDVTTTGDPIFNAPWSYTGLPTITFPIGLSPEGLPLGIQLAGWPDSEGEAGLFDVALWCEATVRRSAGAPDLPKWPATP